jgi:hypothetical protein
VPGAMLFSFAVGVAVGNAMWGNCNWGGGNVSINQNTYNSFNRTNVSNSNWQHQVDHRKGVQYRDTASQNRYGGGQRQGVQSREEFRGRAEQGRQDIGRGGADGFRGQGGAGDRAGGPGVANRAAGPGAGQGGVGDRGSHSGGRDGGAFGGVGNGAQTRDFSNRGASSRESSARNFGGGSGAASGARGGGAAAAGGGARGGGAAAGGGARGGGRRG